MSNAKASPDPTEQAAAQAEKILGVCTCSRAHQIRDMIDPDCAWHNWGEDLTQALASAYTQGRAAGLREVIARCSSYAEPFQAPCVFCGYRGAGYYQSGTHAPACPWHTIGGLMERQRWIYQQAGAGGQT